MNLQEMPNADALWASARAFTVQWIQRRVGSPADFVHALEEHAGWPVRHILPDLLGKLRAERNLGELDRNYLNQKLPDAAVQAALGGGAKNGSEYDSALDELFTRSQRFCRSEQFAKAVEFISKFRDYSPFNNMLVYAQNPMATHFATARHWYQAFRRTVKEDARGMIILAPRRPVLLVYDIADTEGPKLPDKFEHFSKTTGRFNPALFQHLLRNCERDKILVERKPMGPLRAGFATTRLRNQAYKVRIVLREELEPRDAYAVLCHELAHVYLGHIGTDADGWWPNRLNLSNPVAELEAEAVAHIVCRRTGIQTRSAEYLSSFVSDDEAMACVSVDLVSRVAGQLEEMSRSLLPPRKRKLERTEAPF